MGGRGAPFNSTSCKSVNRYLVTVTVAVVAPTLGRALAVIFAEPAATPVTGTPTVVAPAAIVMVVGTLATPGLSELRLMVRPPSGAGAERSSATNCLPFPEMVKLGGEKLSVRVT